MSEFDVDATLVRKLSDLLNETGLTEIEYEEGGRRIRLSRGGAVVGVAPALAPVAEPPTRDTATQAPPQSGTTEPKGDSVTSPMVGTAYLSREPGAPPFVRTGDTVSAGQTIVLIEAMKVFNEIKAPRAGTVLEILVADAQPVEFGEPLLVIG